MAIDTPRAPALASGHVIAEDSEMSESPEEPRESKEPEAPAPPERAAAATVAAYSIDDADEPPPPRLPAYTPWVSWTLVAVNLGVWLITVALGAHAMSPTPAKLFEQGGNLGVVTLSGEEWRLFTSMFLHAGAFHLAMNAIGLITGGKLVERLFGRGGFLGIYLISGLAGSIATALRPGVVSVGASGAIFGMLGALGAYYALHRDRMDAATARESRGLLVFIAYNVVFGFTQAGIDMFAHLGGLAAGFLCGLAIEVRGGGDARPRRTRAVCGAGLALVIAAALLAPPPIDARMEAEQSALNAFTAVEVRVIARWNELLGQAGKGEISEPELADLTEREIVPPWREAEAAFEASEVRGRLREPMLVYIRSRREGWELVVKGLRESDEDAVKKGLAAVQEATGILQRAVEAADQRSKD